MKNNWFCPNCGQPMEAQRHVDNSTGRITWTIGCLNPKHFHTHGYMNAAIAEIQLEKTPPPVKYVSIFSGIEAATVAWHPLGWEPLAFSEIDPFPSTVLQHHYPDIPNLGDITKID